MGSVDDDVVDRADGDDIDDDDEDVVDIGRYTLRTDPRTADADADADDVFIIEISSIISSSSLKSSLESICRSTSVILILQSSLVNCNIVVGDV